MMKKKFFGKVLSAMLIASMVFTSVDVTPLATESVDDSFYEVESLFSDAADEMAETILDEGATEAEEVAELADVVEVSNDADEIVIVEEEEVLEAEISETIEMVEEESLVSEEGDIAGGRVDTRLVNPPSPMSVVGTITWNIDADGKLSVSGNGVPLSIGLGWPWKQYAEEIKTAVISLDNTSIVRGMFEGCENLTSVDLKGLDTTYVTDMDNMFSGCSSLTSLDVSNFDTSKVTNMDNMFSGCSSLTSLDVSSFDTTNVTSMREMFSGCSSLTSLDVSSFDTSNVTNMYEIFSGCSSLTSLDVSSFDTSNITYMGHMFSGCSSLTSLDISSFDTSKVTYMSWMFKGCHSLTSLDVSSFETSNVTGMGGMFSGCSSLTSLDVSSFETSNVTYMGQMFWDCSSLTNLNVSSFETSNVTDMGQMFSGCSSLTSLDVSSFETSNVTYMSQMFWDCSSLTNLNVSSFETSNVTGMGGMFSGCSSLTSLDVSNFDTSKVTDMEGMFSGCSSLTSLDLSGLDTSNVTSIGYMFSDCSSLTSLDLSGLDTSNVTKMERMFSGCSGLISLDLSSFETSNVTNMYEIFSGCRSLTSLDVSGFDTSKVTWMYGMFKDCSSLTSLDVSGFETSNVTNMGGMFSGCSSLTSLDVSGFDTTNVTNMTSMFYGCISLTDLDVSGFNTSNVTGVMSWTFGYCSSITSLDLSGWDVSNIKGYNTIFYNCYSLKEIKTPLNVQGYIQLPNGSSGEEWYIVGSDGTKINVVPLNLTDSVTLLRQVKPKISITNTSEKVIVGDTILFNAVIYNLPEGKSNEISWKSSDESVATVDAEGYVTAKATGETTITATSVYDSTLIATCTVTVEEGVPTAVTAISLFYDGKVISKDGVEISLNDTVTVKAVVAPSNASNKKVTWKTSDEKIATITSSNGSVEIKGISEGEAVIIATTEDGNFEANCKVVVKPVVVTGVSISYNNAAISANGLTLNKGNKLTLTANVLPTNATEKSISWNSSDKTVATVSDNGLVTAVASGNAVITVTTKDGAKTASCNVVVTNETGNDSASSNNAGGTPSGNNTPSGNDIPGGNQDQKPIYKVSVTYDENGLVSANRTATVSDGNVSEVVTKDAKSTFDVMVVSSNEVSFVAKPNAEHGVASVKVELPKLKYTLEEVSGNEVASPDGSIKISKADKDGNVTITLKAISENAVVTVGFKRTTFAVSMNTADGSTVSIQIVDGKVIDPATGKEMTSLPTPEQAGLIFTGWVTADGTEVTMDNIAEIAMKGTKVSAKFDYMNLVIKQKQDVTALMNISENTVVKKYVTYLVDEKGNVQKNAKGKDIVGTKYLSVSSKGIAQAKKDGTVKVVALDASKNEVASCYIRVVKPVVKSVKDIPVLSVKTASLNMADYITNLPTNSSELVWSLANEKIAKIDAKTGKLTLNGSGSGKVKVIATFSHKDAKTGLTTSSKFTTSVTVKLPKMSKAEDKETTVKVNKAGSLKMTNLVGQKVEWKVENPEILEVVEQKDAIASSTLKVKGLKADSTKVTATIDGVTYTFKVVVK